MKLATPSGAILDVAEEAAGRYMACGFRPLKSEPKEEKPEKAPSKKSTKKK